MSALDPLNIFDDLFKGTTDIQDIRSPERKKADKFLAGLLGQGTPELPTEEVAGMSQAEQLAQKLVGQYGASEPEGLDTLRGITGESDDILQDPSIKALLDVLDKRGSLESNRLSRSLTLRGVTGGSGRDALGRGLQDVQNNILATLAPYAEASKNRKVSAAQILNQLGESSVLNRLNALGTTGALPRILEQLQKTAQYTQAMRKVLFPYEELAGVAGTLTNSQGDNVITQTPSILQQLAPLAQAAAGAAM